MSIHWQEFSALPLFSGLTDEGRQLVEQHAQVHDCNKSDVLIRAGEGVSGAYIVLSGRLRVYSLFPDGHEATLYGIAAGETCMLAINSLFNDLLYPAWAEAEESTRLAIIPGQAFKRLFNSEPSMQNLTVCSLSTLVFRLMGELSNVHGLNTRQRLASLLITRANSQGLVTLTQQELAQHLGTRREVVARLMLEFVDHGWVKTGRGQLQLLDVNGLRTCLSN